MTDAFTIYPAIDLRGGRVVRLTQGRADAETVYRDDPVAVAREFKEQGATWLHVVNLDGAFDGASDNLRILGDIYKEVGLNIQFGGGLRFTGDVRTAIELGAARVVLGTLAVRDPAAVRDIAKVYGPQIAVGLDVRDGHVAVSGWVEDSRMRPDELAAMMIDCGVERFIYTDINRDGMMSGPDLRGAAKLAELGAPVIASGGVGELEHVREARATGGGVDGIIIGKALYEGKFTLKEALG